MKLLKKAFTFLFLSGATFSFSQNISQTNSISCNGQLTAALSATPGSGLAPFTYSWSPSGGTASVAIGLGAGSYTCFFTDASSVVTTATFDVMQPPLLATSVSTLTNVSCNGYLDGAVSVSVTGGTSPYSYSWSPVSGSSAAISNLGAGTYSCFILDASNCMITQTAVVSQPAALTVTANTTSSVICFGNTITLNGLGASSYSWTGGVNNGVSFMPSFSSTYTLTGTDLAGCNGTATISISVNPLPTVSIIGTSTLCSGDPLALSATGANSYTWSTSANTASISISPTINTTYTVTGINGFGCTNTDLKTIVVYSLPVVTANSSTTSVCSGNSVTLFGTGANSYNWSNSVSDNVSFIPSSTNTYTVTGTDLNGCQNTATKTIVVYALPNVIANVTNSIICLGDFIKLFGSGAQNYLWSGGVTNNVNFSPSSTNTYSVIGTDANGCQNSAIKTITVNTLPNVVANCSNSVICFGFPTSLFGSGATTYTWSGNVTNNVAISPTVSTTYTVVGTDGNGCENSATKLITVNPLPMVSAFSGNFIICNGQTTSVFGAGASTYTWSNNVLNNILFTPSVTAVYSVTGTDLNGCQNTAVTGVTVNPLPLVIANTTNSVFCFGNSTTLYGSGASTYTWTGNVLNAVSFTPSATVTYTVSGTDVNGCVNTSIKTITVNQLPPISANASSSAVCIGNTVSLSGSGANTYTWSGGIINGGTISPTVTNSYFISGTNTLTGCINSASTTVVVNPLPIVTVGSSSPTYCLGGGGQIFANGTADTYTWTGGLINYLPYTFSVTTTNTVTGIINATGCYAKAVLTVTVFPRPVVVANITNSVICFGEFTTVYGTGAHTYSWSGNISATNNVPFSPQNTSNYVLGGTNTLTGCTSTNWPSVWVTVNPLPTPTITLSSSAICIGNTVSVNASGAGTYTWTSGIIPVIPFTPTSTTIFTVTGTNTLTGCSNTTGVTQTITVNPLPNVGIGPNYTVICQGSYAILTGTGASTYTWSGGVNNMQAFFPTATNTYTVIGKNSQTGCTNTATQMVIVNNTPTLTLAASATEVCFGQAVVLTSTGADTYTFTNGVTNGTPFYPTMTNSYSVVGTDTLTGCTNTYTPVQTITVNPLPIVSATLSNSIICEGMPITLIGSGADTYTWTGGVQNGVAFIPIVSSSFSVVGTNTVTGCTSTNIASQSVTVNALPIITLTQNKTLLCIGETNTLSASGALSYNWSTNDTTSFITISPLLTTQYLVTGTDINGCSNTATLSQLVSECTELSESKSLSRKRILIYPNPTKSAFTVSSDNDVNLFISNEMGQIIQTILLNKSNNYTQQFSHLSRGIYFINGLNGREVIKEKLIVID